MKHAFIVFFTLATCSLFSQKSSIGIRAGINRAQLKSYSHSFDANNGIMVGFAYSHGVGRKSNVIVDFLYTQKGFQNNLYIDLPVSLGANGKILYNINYFSVPIKFGYRFGEKEIIFANIGVVPSRVLRANKIIKPGGDLDNIISSFKDEIMTYDLAGVFEIGIYLKSFEQSVMFLSLGINRSFTKTYNWESHNKYSLKHFAMDLSFGCQLNKNQGN